MIGRRRPARRGALLAALAWLVAACSSPDTGPSAAPTLETCRVTATLFDGGPSTQVRGEGFTPDQPASLVLEGPSGRQALDETTNPALRTDVRGVVVFGIDAAFEDVGTTRIEMSAGGCTATTSVEVSATMFAPPCPAEPPAHSGGAPAAAYEALVLADGPLAYWRFEEESGTEATGTAGEDATLTGDPTFAQAGAIPGSRALGLDGDGDGVDAVDIELPGDFTIEGWAWFCGDPITERDVFAGMADGTPPNLNAFEEHWRLWEGERDVAVIEPPLKLGRWYHLAATRAGLSVRLYVDGTDAGNGTWDGTFTVDTIGLGGGSMTGQLDEVAVYDHALTPAQLAARVAAAAS